VKYGLENVHVCVGWKRGGGGDDHHPPWRRFKKKLTTHSPVVVGSYFVVFVFEWQLDFPAASPCFPRFIWYGQIGSAAIVAQDQEGRQAGRGRTTAATTTNRIARQQIPFLFQRQVGGSNRLLLGRLGRYMFGLFASWTMACSTPRLCDDHGDNAPAGKLSRDQLTGLIWAHNYDALVEMTFRDADFLRRDLVELERIKDHSSGG
jgi:hypothetical protein